MDQKPPQSSDTPQSPSTPAPLTPPSDAPASPPSSEHKEDHPTETPANPVPTSSAPAEQHSDASPAGPTPPVTPMPGSPNQPSSPDHPQDPVHKKNNAMIYAVVTLLIVVIGAGLVTFMAGSNQPATNTTAAQPTQPPAPTEVPLFLHHLQQLKK